MPRLVPVVLSLLLVSLPGGAAVGDEKQPGWLGVILDGATISRVVPGGPAAKAGLTSGDVLQEIDGRKIATLEDVRTALGKRSAGEEVAVRYRRGEAEATTKVVLGKRGDSPFPFPPGGPETLDTPPHYDRERDPLPLAASLKAGLAWLASEQEESGMLPAGPAFPGYSQRFHVAVTSIGGMALMLDPGHEAAAEKALRFVLSCGHADGYVYFRAPSFKGMWEHGFATQFLAEMLLRKRSRGEETSKIEKALRRAVALIERVQNLEGGWGYRAMPDPHAEVGPGAAMLDALLLARKGGIPVRKRTIERGLQSQCALMLPPRPETTQGEWRSFSYEANAFTVASLLGWKDRPDTKVYLEALRSVSPEGYFATFTESTRMRGVYWATGNHTLGLFYTALAFRRLGESRAEEFAKWHERVAAGLAKMQREGGAFKGWFGDVYGTAFTCLTLGARTGKLAQFAADGVPVARKEIDAAGAPAIALEGERKLAIGAFLSAAKSRHGWKGLSATRDSVGLKEGATEWSPTDLEAFLPAGPVPVGREWEVPAETVERLFSPFHPHVRGVMAARATAFEKGTLTLELRALVKFGEASASHVQTTSFDGTARIDAANGQFLSLTLETISGCTRVRQGRGRYVTLNDVHLRLASGEAPAGAAPDKPSTGGKLLVGNVDAKEPVAATPEEVHLGLKAHPNISQARPFWLFVPGGLAEGSKPPLVLVFHRRGRLRSFSARQVFGGKDLEIYAGKDLAAWKDLAAKEKFALLVPLGEPDILWMGMAWRTGDRGRLVTALLDAAAGMHAFDRSRVYLVGTGEGAHAALATAVRMGGGIAAVAACNPPLFTGALSKGDIVYPETAAGLAAASKGRRPPMLVLAGTRDTELSAQSHRNLAVKTARYQDSSRIPAAHIRKAVDVLVKAGFEIEFVTIDTRHYAPLPDERVEEVWNWLSKRRVPEGDGK